MASFQATGEEKYLRPIMDQHNNLIKESQAKGPEFENQVIVAFKAFTILFYYYNKSDPEIRNIINKILEPIPELRL